MCDAAVVSLIVEVLDEKMQNKEVFTAFDVTSAVRAKTGARFDHDNVRNTLNNDFVNQHMTGYNRELRNLNVTGNPGAFVYFPVSKSASDHPLSMGDPVTDDDDDDTDGVVLGDDEYKVTQEGSVNIPKKIFSQVHLSGGSYDILIEGGITKSVTPNKDGRVRVYIRHRGFGIKTNKVKITVDKVRDTISIDA